MSEPSAKLFVVAAPSGAGKTTLVHALVTRHPELRFSISYTTRPKRRNEADGVDYLFVDERVFAKLRDEGALLEHAEVFDNHYGTSRAQVQEHLAQGHNVVLEIDWQGARQVRDSMPDCVTVFILPPSHDELVRRLKDRGTDTDDVIDRRLRDAVSDMAHWNEFDYAVINDNLDQAVADLESVLSGNSRQQATTNEALRLAIAAIVD